MSSQAVTLPFGGGQVVVAGDGRLEARAEGLGTVGIGVVGAQLTPILADAGVAEHIGTVAGMDLAQRVMTEEFCLLRWSVAVPEGATDARMELRVELEAGQAAWMWPSGADGLLAVLPTSRGGPVLALRAVQAELRIASGSSIGEAGAGESVRPHDPPQGLRTPAGQVETGFAQARSAARPDRAIRAGDLESSRSELRILVTPPRPAAGRQVVILQLRVVPSLSEVASLLPGWFEPLTLQAGECWSAPLADLGLDCEPPVEVSFTDLAADVAISAPVGRHRVGIHGRRGVTEVVLEVAPPIRTVLGDVARRLCPDAGLDGAGAFVVHRAVGSGVISRTSTIEDALDRFDWSSKPGAEAVAFGSERALAEGELAMALAALRRCAALPEGLGRSRVRSMAWFAATALGVEAVPPVDAAADLATERLEVDLTLGRRTAWATDRLAAAIQRLGAGLPGFPVGLDPVVQAQLAGLLACCPEDWPEAPLAAATAQAAIRCLLASYAAGELTDPAPLAWLLIYG